jgi:non-homologous end joining protein Ku
MVELAGHILHTKAAHFDPSKFKDEYEDALKALVRRKASGKTIKLPEPEEKPDNVINLMDALKASLKGKSAAKRRAHGSTARRAPARRTAKKAHRSAARHRKAG